MFEMLEKPKKAEEQEAKVDPRLAEVVRIIVERFNGDLGAFFDAIRPNTDRRGCSERQGRQLVEEATRSL